MKSQSCALSGRVGEALALLRRGPGRAQQSAPARPDSGVHTGGSALPCAAGRGALQARPFSETLPSSLEGAARTALILQRRQQAREECKRIPGFPQLGNGTHRGVCLPAECPLPASCCKRLAQLLQEPSLGSPCSRWVGVLGAQLCSSCQAHSGSLPQQETQTDTARPVLSLEANSKHRALGPSGKTQPGNTAGHEHVLGWRFPLQVDRSGVGHGPLRHSVPFLAFWGLPMAKCLWVPPLPPALCPALGPAAYGSEFSSSGNTGWLVAVTPEPRSHIQERPQSWALSGAHRTSRSDPRHHHRGTARVHPGRSQMQLWGWAFLDWAPCAGSGLVGCVLPSLSGASVSLLARWGKPCVQDAGGSMGSHSGRVCGCCVDRCVAPTAHLFTLHCEHPPSRANPVWVPCTLCLLQGPPPPIFQGSSPREGPGRKEKAFLNLLGG